MTAAELALALVRTTLATSAAACLAALLLAALRVDSPRVHRIAWLLVLLQGWLLIPWTLELAAPPQPAPAPLGAVSTPAWTWIEPTIGTDFPQTPAPEPARAPLTPIQLALAAWLAGAAFITLYAVARYIRIVRALPLGAPPDEPSWQAEWRDSLAAMFQGGTRGGGTPKSAQGVVESPSRYESSPRPAGDLGRATQNRIDFRITARLGPLVAYIPFAYVLLAPRRLWTTLTPAERTAILRHELAHVRRRDLWKSLIIRLLALPQWFNPLVWRAVRRFDEAAEWACDESAIKTAACGLAPERTTLANALLRTAELTVSQTMPRAAGLTPAVPTGAPNKVRSHLQRRIHRLVTPRFKEESPMRKLAVPALLAVLAAAQLIRIERVSAQDPPPSGGWQQPSTVAGGDRAQGGSPSIPAAGDPPRRPVEDIVMELHEDRETAEETRAAIADASSQPGDQTVPAPAKRRPYDENAWPRYIIEPPDVLLINGVKLVPKSPHRLEAFDVLIVRAAGAFPDQPIDDSYAVDADGTINLGPTYGRVKVVGLTLEEAEKEIQAKLSKILTDVEASASLVASAGAQQVSGQHLVAMDGRVNLGVYGSVYVAGLTIEQAREAIEKKLGEHLEQAKVSVDVLAYNSKVYYVILKGSRGDHVTRMPITGNDTVIDAVAAENIRTTDGVKMYIARAGGIDGVGAERIIPIAWNDITNGTSDDTNYTLHPGDRLFIDEPRYREPAAGDDSAPADEAAAAEPIHDSDLPNYYQYVRPQLDAAQALAAPQAFNPTTLPADPASPTITIILRQNGGEMVMQQSWSDGWTVGAAIRGGMYPNPINFGDAIISLERTLGEGPYAESKRWAIGWDKAKNQPREGDDRTLLPNDRIVIDVTKRLSRRWLETAQPNQPPVQPPRPVQEAPLAPPAQQVMFKLSVVRDTSGDMAELGGSLREMGSATGDSESMLSVLRILRKHKLVEVVADPQVVTVLGRPASIAIEPQATGDAGELTAVVGPIAVEDGVLRLEAGMSLGETRIDRGFDLPLGETVVIAAPPHDKVGPNKLYLVVTPELVDGPQPQP
jgi:polysaccharide biosynthesis/export protein